MSFPAHDNFWLNTYTFVKGNLHPQDTIVASTEFREKFNKVTEYLLIEREDRAEEFQWVILHKGKLNCVEIGFLQQTQRYLNPVYANEVFIVFSSHDHLPQLDVNSPHIKPLLDYLTKAIRNEKYSGYPGPTNFSSTTVVPAVYLGDYTALIKNKYGHKMYVDTRDLSLAPHLLMDGYWEPWITKLFLTLVKPGMNIVEVGSNIGYYSLLGASIIGKNGFIHCFEANPHLCELLRRNLDINGFIPVSKSINKAVSDRQGKTKFRIQTDYLGGSFMCFSYAHQQPGKNVEIIEIESTSLDKELGQDYRVDLLKIDAEGAEPVIIPGAYNLLKNNQDIKIIVEFHMDHFTPEYGEDRDPDLYLQSFRDLGFKINLIAEDSKYHEVSNAEIINNPYNQELFLFR